ncbi:MAG: hypothetical protein AABX24_00745 [Nanoarchaeota archaeon]
MAKPIETIAGNVLENLVNQCLIVTDKKGKIIGRSNTPISAWLAMEYQADYGKIKFDVNVSAMGNGHYIVTVQDGEQIVFRAEGNYMVKPFNSKTTKYVSGKWENKLKREYTKLKR